MTLTLREKICQSVIVRAEPEKHIKEFGSIENFMKQYPVGGIFIGSEICPFNEKLNSQFIMERVFARMHCRVLRCLLQRTWKS